MLEEQCGGNAEAEAACLAAMALVEDALAQLSDELTTCAQWSEARSTFMNSVRSDNRAQTTQISRSARIGVEEAHAPEVEDLSRRLAVERQAAAEDGQMTVAVKADVTMNTAVTQIHCTALLLSRPSGR